MNSEATKDEELALSALKDLEASEIRLTFVIDPDSRQLLKLDGPWEDFLDLSREEIKKNPFAWERSVMALDRAEAMVTWHRLKQRGFVTRTLTARGRNGQLRELRISINHRTWGGRTLIAGSLVEIEGPIEGPSDKMGLSSMLRQAIERAPIGFAVTDANGCFLYLNHEHSRMFGYDSAAELIGKSWRLLYNDDNAEIVAREGIATMTATGSWHGDVEARRKNGSAFHQRVHLTALANGGILCNSRDISDRIDLSRRLERSETLFRHFLNGLQTGVSIRNSRGEYEFVNRATISFLGMECARGGSCHCPSYCEQSTDQSNQVVMEVCLSRKEIWGYWGTVDERVRVTGEPIRFDFPLTWGGRDWILYVEKLPLRIAANEVTHICTLVSDVTQIRQTESQEKASARQRDEYLAMQREFISMVSHEFRTPLTAIHGLQQLIGSHLQEQDAAKRARWNDLQGQALTTLKNLVEQVLSLNRIESLASVIAKPTLLRPLISRLMESIAATLESDRIHTTLDVPQGCIVQADEVQIRVLLENLISNALKYSSRPVRVALTTEVHHWRLAVTDEGRGIPQADQARLFSLFYRASNVGKVPGTGLGLAIVRRCVDFHHGEVLLESQEGLGSTFIVRIPFVSNIADPTKQPGSETISPFGVSPN